MAKHALKILRCYERRVKKTKLTFLKSKFPGLSIQLTGHIGILKKNHYFKMSVFDTNFF